MTIILHPSFRYSVLTIGRRASLKITPQLWIPGNTNKAQLLGT